MREVGGLISKRMDVVEGKDDSVDVVVVEEKETGTVDDSDENTNFTVDSVTGMNVGDE